MKFWNAAVAFFAVFNGAGEGIRVKTDCADVVTRKGSPLAFKIAVVTNNPADLNRDFCSSFASIGANLTEGSYPEDKNHAFGIVDRIEGTTPPFVGVVFQRCGTKLTKESVTNPLTNTPQFFETTKSKSKKNKCKAKDEAHEVRADGSDSATLS